MYKDERFAVICVVILITLLFCGVVFASLNLPCKIPLMQCGKVPLKQCVNGELYIEKGSFMVGTGKKCFEKGADNV